MSTKKEITFNKEKLNDLLNKLSKVYKKLGGRKAVSQIVLVGGASVLAAYHFRDSTTDIDAFGNILKEAVVKIADEYNLPYDWLNKDFMKSESYTPLLYDYSVYYKTFNQVFEVRIVKGACLIAMKLKSARTYKKDLSDIIGILKEEKENGHPLTLEEVKTMYNKLYGNDSYDKLEVETRDFFETHINLESFDKNFKIIREVEEKNKAIMYKKIEYRVKNNIHGKLFTTEVKKSDMQNLLKKLKK